jgi:hypothetical protein
VVLNLRARGSAVVVVSGGRKKLDGDDDVVGGRGEKVRTNVLRSEKLNVEPKN